MGDMVDVDGFMCLIGGVNSFAYILALMVLGFTIVVHNPAYPNEPEQKKIDGKMTYLNSIVIAALLVVAGSGGSSASKVEEEPEAESEEEEPQGDKGPKNKKKGDKKSKKHKKKHK